MTQYGISFGSYTISGVYSGAFPILSRWFFFLSFFPLFSSSFFFFFFFFFLFFQISSQKCHSTKGGGGINTIIYSHLPMVKGPTATQLSMNSERWIRIRHFFNDRRSRSCVAFTTALYPAPIPLVTRLQIYHDVTAPRKELKGHDYSASLLEIIIINAKVMVFHIRHFFEKKKKILSPFRFFRRFFIFSVAFSFFPWPFRLF